VRADDATRQALCAAALALGIDSIRAPLLALRAACAHAALEGRIAVDPSDAIVAARLVLLPRATTLPAAADEPAAEEGDDDDGEPASAESNAGASRRDATSRAMEDSIREAASAVLPPGLLDLLTASGMACQRLRSEGRSGAPVTAGLRGRPNGALHGHPRSGARLNLMETLRAAAPWQVLRRPAAGAQDSPTVLQVRREDFRVTRFKQRS